MSPPSDFLERLGSYGLDSGSIDLIASVPRSNFVASSYASSVWSNESLPLPCGQTLWSPDLMARIFAESRLESTHTVLEFGTGSGYLGALLGRGCRKVYSVERYARLASDARSCLGSLGIDNVIIEHADALSIEVSGLYDRIICDSCFPSALIDNFLDYLVVGGFVICGLTSDDGTPHLVRLTKSGSRFSREDLFPVPFTNLESGLSGTL